MLQKVSEMEATRVDLHAEASLSASQYGPDARPGPLDGLGRHALRIKDCLRRIRPCRGLCKLATQQSDIGSVSLSLILTLTVTLILSHSHSHSHCLALSLSFFLSRSLSHTHSFFLSSPAPPLLSTAFTLYSCGCSTSVPPCVLGRARAGALGPEPALSRETRRRTAHCRSRLTGSRFPCAGARRMRADPRKEQGHSLAPEARRRRPEWKWKRRHASRDGAHGPPAPPY